MAKRCPHFFFEIEILIEIEIEIEFPSGKGIRSAFIEVAHLAGPNPRPVKNFRIFPRRPTSKTLKSV